MKRRLFRSRQTVLFLILAAVSAVAASSSTPRLKARYYYMEGARAQAAGEEASAYEYFKKAYMLDPSYKEAASSYGSQRLIVRTDTLQTLRELRNSLSLMQGFVDEYIDDFDEALFYALAAAHLDTLPEAVRVHERLAERMNDKTAVLVQLSEEYMRQGNRDKAIEALDKAERIEGKVPEFSMRKMSYMLAGADTTAAIAEANSLVASNPREPVYRLLKGNLFDILNMPDSVESNLLTAEQLNPELGDTKLALANFYRRKGDSIAFDTKMYETLMSADFDMQKKTELLAEYLQKLIDDKNDTKRGDVLFDVLRSQYPHEPRLLDLSARFSAAKGDMAHAIEQISYAIDLQPATENFWGQKMSYLMADGQYDRAIETFRKSGEHIPPATGLRMLLASAAVLGERYDVAEDAYRDLIHEIVPDLPLTEPVTDPKLRDLDYESLSRLSSYYTMLGDMYYAARQLEKSYAAYDNSLFFFPSNAMTLNNYAYFLVENGGDTERAYEMSRRAIDEEPDNETFLDTFAWILFKKGEYEEAKKYQEQAVELSKERGDESEELYSHYADILEKCGDSEGAAAARARASELK